MWPTESSLKFNIKQKGDDAMFSEQGKCAYGGGAAAAAIAIAEAIKASGAIVRVTSEAFQSIVQRNEKPLIVAAKSTFLKTSYSYLTSYRGFVFFAKSDEPLLFKSTAEIIEAKKIWIPG
jgi:isocitrate/isopropylmalate dehydrogenase